MFFLILRRRQRGVAASSAQLRKQTPLRGQVSIGEHMTESLGRVSTQAWVFNPAPGADVIPRLLDARVTGMAAGGMNITGVEEVEGVLYAQSWWCRACS